MEIEITTDLFSYRKQKTKTDNANFEINDIAFNVTTSLFDYQKDNGITEINDSRYAFVNFYNLVLSKLKTKEIQTSVQYTVSDDIVDYNREKLRSNE
jgi:hypothetical protein